MTTPDTTRYFYSAYAIIFVTLTFYVISLIVRWNNLRNELDALNELEKENKL
jgi:CcmD family protein